MTELYNEIYEVLVPMLSQVKESLASISVAEIRGKNLMKDLGLDSLDVFSLILRIEESLSIQFPTDDLDSLGLMDTDNMAKYIFERVKEKSLKDQSSPNPG